MPKTVPPRSLMTRAYSRVEGLRRRGIMSAAGGPCEMPGCRWSSGLDTVYVYDHCHRHDYIRGVICGYCNRRMALIDAHVAECAGSAYLDWWGRCPECAAGPWEPWVTRREYDQLQRLASRLRMGPELAARLRLRLA